MTSQVLGPRTGFQRHLEVCNNTSLPGHRLPLRLAGELIGYVEPALFESRLLSDFLGEDDSTGVLTMPSADALPLAAVRLAELGRIVLQHEDFDVRSDEGGPVLGTVDRGALPVFGITAAGAHLNGLVERGADVFLWIARRAHDKLLDSGKLDHLAAGGVSAGLNAEETLAKEAAEECGLTATQLEAARKVAIIRYAVQRPEGLRRDVLHCFDVTLPDTWQPVAHDGEVEAFELWPLSRVYEAVRDADDFKFNVNLVLIDLFIRRGLIDRHSEEGQRLRRGLMGIART